MIRHNRPGRVSVGSLVFGVATAAFSLASHAQQVPNAGQIQRQLEQEIRPPSVTPPPLQPAARPAQTPDQGAKVTLQSVQIEGATLIPADQLAHHFDPYLNHPVALGELQQAAQDIVGDYRRHGWFARVDLPPQDVTSGVLRVRITEGRFGKIGLTDGKTRADADFVAGVVGARLHEGQPYSLADLERGILLANDLPGIQADGTLRAGTVPGTSDLSLAVTDQPWVSGQVSAGNQGNRSTGYGQGTAQVAVNDISGRGDQLSVAGVLAERLQYGQVNYATPLGHDGLRLDLGYSYLHYRLGREFDDLDAKGHASTVQANLAYPLKRSADSNLWVALNVAHRDIHDDMLDEPLHDRRVDTASVSLYGDLRDGWGGGGANAWHAALTQGNAKLLLAADRAADADGPDVAGNFTRFNLDGRRDQWLAPAWYLHTQASAQWAADNLDASQQFSLGGPYGVRGYPLNEGTGDNGALLQVEAHRLLNDLGLPNTDAYAFFDAGVIRQHHTTWTGWDTGDTGRNTYPLYSAGLGVRWTHRGGFQVDTIVAAPIGDNPGGTDGRNQDGSHRGAQFWLTASYAF